ncbi:MAG: hypothetical protein IKG21_07910 [Atopobiaceae bacterium]|nr:hypothetical protein [Atopobiaceae bacterium]
MTTTVSMWGNSVAVRIPRAILGLVNLAAGDQVNLMVNERGNIELSAVKEKHRHVQPAKAVTFDSVFAGYDGNRLDSSSAWPNDDMVGSEKGAWS